MAFDAIQSPVVTDQSVGVAARCAEILESLPPAQAEQAILAARSVARIKNPNSELNQEKIARLCEKIGLTEEDMQNRDMIIRLLSGVDETLYRQQIRQQVLDAQVVK